MEPLLPTRLLFPLEPEDPDPATLYGSSSLDPEKGLNWGGPVDIRLSGPGADWARYRDMPGGNLDLSISMATILITMIHSGHRSGSSRETTPSSETSSSSSSAAPNAMALIHWFSNLSRSGLDLLSSRLKFC